MNDHGKLILSTLTMLCLLVNNARSDSAPLSQVSGSAVSFEEDIQPLLEKHCNRCHHPDNQSGGLDLTRIQTMLRGGDNLGASVIPGKPEKSPLIHVLTGEAEPAMPEGEQSLSPSEIDLLRNWIREGAEDDFPQFPQQDLAFFESRIRPVLVKNCYKCHAGEDAEHGLRLTSRRDILAGGSRGPAAILGQPEDSLLIQAISHDRELKMPLGGDRLTREEVDAFKQWISRGMAWPAHDRVLVRSRQFSISDADRQHWAYRPLPRKLPDNWSVDTELAKHHERLDITPAAMADPHRLLRRVTYDLIGYPPTPDEISTFLADDSPEAFEKVVDRLLNSPEYGLRWGRHWIDYTRNGSTGQPTRGPAIEANRYETWVVKCFNEDRPWDWFVRVHLAGDLMKAYEGGDYSIDQALAAAVPINGARTFQEVGTDTFVLMDKLDEGIEFMGRSLMGISIECARCHDHKTDPFSQKDYYALLGFFQSSGFAPIAKATPTRENAKHQAERIRELMREDVWLSGRIRTAGTQLNISGGGVFQKWKDTRFPIRSARDKRLLEVELLITEAELEQALNDSQASIINDIQGVIETLEDRLAHHEFDLETLPQSYSHPIIGHKSQIGLIERARNCGREDLIPELEDHHEFWLNERATQGERQRYGGYSKNDPEVAELLSLDKRVKEIDRQLPANITRPWESPDPTHLYVRCEGGYNRVEDIKEYDLEATNAGIRINSNSPERPYLAPAFIGDARFLYRGDVLFPEDLVERDVPELFGPANLKLTGSGRLQLANWLTELDSIQAALVARNAVNRVFQQLFGSPLCRTPMELGRFGDVPEMPELIDQLAVRLIESNWSIKQLIREIILSDAYQRSSMIGSADRERDIENRYFARQSVRRLESEAIVSTMAWLSNGRRYSSSSERDAALNKANQFFEYFDGPSIYELIDRRNVSIVPTQALFLMNNPDTTEAIATEIVDRLKIDECSSVSDALSKIYLQVLQRPPSESEHKRAAHFLDEYRTSSNDVCPSEVLKEITVFLLCGHELLYIE